MRNIDNNELLSIQGGGISFGILTGIGAFVVFAVGIIDGYLRPKTCNK